MLAKPRGGASSALNARELVGVLVADAERTCAIAGLTFAPRVGVADTPLKGPAVTDTSTELPMSSAELAAEVEHLLAFGLWPERVAAQVGYEGRLRALRALLEKHDRQDLSTQLYVNPIPRECKADGMAGPCRQPALKGRNVCRMHAKGPA